MEAKAWYMYPSLWQNVPTALLHFLLVEIRALFAAVVSWYMLVYNMLHMTDTSGYSKETIGIAVNIFFALVGIPALMLLIYGLYGYVVHAGAPKSCGSGAYLGWTWRLEQDKIYKLLVASICFFPGLCICMVAYDVAQVWLNVEGHHKDKGDWKPNKKNVETLFPNMIIPLVVMLVALGRLAMPLMPPNGWDRDQVDNLLLARSWSQCLWSNDLYGLRFIDALWKAENGKHDELHPFLRCAQDEPIVLHVCREALVDEAKEA